MLQKSQWPRIWPILYTLKLSDLFMWRLCNNLLIYRQRFQTKTGDLPSYIASHYEQSRGSTFCIHKRFKSHPKYHSYYSSPESDNSIKTASDQNEGPVALWAAVLLLFLLSRSGSSITAAGLWAGLCVLAGCTDSGLVSVCILITLGCSVGPLGLADSTTAPAIITALSSSPLGWSDPVDMVLDACFRCLALSGSIGATRPVIMSPKKRIQNRHASQNRTYW